MTRFDRALKCPILDFDGHVPPVARIIQSAKESSPADVSHTGDLGSVPELGIRQKTVFIQGAPVNPCVLGVHVKDFVYDRARNPSDVIIGEGNLKLPAFMAALKQINFTGPLVIEYEGDIEKKDASASQLLSTV